MACDGSGAGMMPSVRAKVSAASNVSFWRNARASRKWRVREIPVSIRYTEYSRSKGQSLLNGVNILFDLSVRHRG